MSRRRGADKGRDLKPKEAVYAFPATYERLVEEIQRKHPDWDVARVEAYIRERASGGTRAGR